MIFASKDVFIASLQSLPGFEFLSIVMIPQTSFSLLSPDELKKIDLTGNQISTLDQDSLLSLPKLQDLFLADNRIEFLPELPTTMRHIDVSQNLLKSAGMHREGFKVTSGNIVVVVIIIIYCVGHS